MAPGSPNVTVGSRLLFVWFCVWALLVTIPISIIQTITHRFNPTAGNFKKWCRVWGGSILKGIGVRVQLEDRAGLDPTRPYIFITNHQNLLDILALGAALPYPFGFVAKQELRQIPFLGFAIGNSASIFIDRSDPRKSIESLRRAGERIRNGNSVLLFAEGHRSYAPVVYPFKKGAFALALEAGAPIAPITILDAYRLMDERRKVLRRGTIHIVVGEPISLEGLRRRDIPAFMETVRARVAAELVSAKEADLETVYPQHASGMAEE